MWETIDTDPCTRCSQLERKKMQAQYIDMQTDDLFMDKENLQPIKCDEISLYDTNSPVRQPICTGTSPSHCMHNVLPHEPLQDHDSNSQDSGYGTSYTGENGKFLSYVSPLHGSPRSFESGSLCSMEDEFLEDFSDMEPLDKNNLPQDFNKLISEPLIHRSKALPQISPKDIVMRPVFRRYLSLQNTQDTPNSSKVRSCLFKQAQNDSEIRFKRPDPPSAEFDGSSGAKRSKIFDDDSIEDDIPSVPEALQMSRPVLKRAFSATEESIMCAVQRSSIEPDLIGDFSKNFCLPLTKGRHQDLKAITPYTLAQLMQGKFEGSINSFKVIDCRYPYEFDGGHIMGAVNIYTKEQCMETLLSTPLPATEDSHKRNILVFHCEFSSERGPNLYRYLRKEDRHKNESAYPSLNYPEIYLLEGGYKNFFEQFADMCVPIAYKRMLHPDHEEDLKHFRLKSKTWNMDSRQRPQRSKHLKRLL